MTDSRPASLDVSDVHPVPVSQFQIWFEEAKSTSLEIPESMAVATANQAGRPSVRTVLCKSFDTRGFVFYTNYKSSKSEDLIENPLAELLFYWEPLARQVRIFGAVEKVTEEESEAYFQSRPRGSQIGAWASPQSQTVKDRDELLKLYKEQEARFGDADIPVPPFWGGFRVIPELFEFWQGRNHRFHDRIRYQKAGDDWNITRLAP